MFSDFRRKCLPLRQPKKMINERFLKGDETEHLVNAETVEIRFAWLLSKILPERTHGSQCDCILRMRAFRRYSISSISWILLKLLMCTWFRRKKIFSMWTHRALRQCLGKSFVSSAPTWGIDPIQTRARKAAASWVFSSLSILFRVYCIS